MKSLFKIISVLALLCMIGCQKDNVIHYNNITMGNFTEGKFIDDQGLIFDIVELKCSEVPDTIKRAIITCDVLDKIDDTNYTIRLNSFQRVLTKAIVDSTAVTDSTMFIENPLSIGEMWYSGGYINMFIYIPMKKDSNTPHVINLIRNDENAEAGVYEFTLKHNANGEVITLEDNNFVVGGAYVSFPISYLIKEDKAKICINWTSHEEVNGLWLVMTKRNTIGIEWTRHGFEHQQLVKAIPASYRQNAFWM